MKYLSIFILFAIKAQAQVKPVNKVSNREVSWGTMTPAKKKDTSIVMWSGYTVDEQISNDSLAMAFWRKGEFRCGTFMYDKPRVTIFGKWLPDNRELYDEGYIEYIDNNEYKRPLSLILKNDTLRVSIDTLLLKVINRAKVIEVDGKVFKIETK